MSNSLSYAIRDGWNGGDDLVWCAQWRTGRRVDISPRHLEAMEERVQPTDLQCVERVSKWAAKGNSDAAWWLGWWYEGSARQRSTWYYIAAMRINPSAHGWAFERVLCDTLYGLTHNSPHPPIDVGFVKQLHEVKTGSWCADWLTAVRNAQAAGDVHQLASEAQIERAAALHRAGSTVRKCALSAGVTELGLCHLLRDA